MATIGNGDRQLIPPGIVFERVCGSPRYRIVCYLVAAVLLGAAFLKLFDAPNPFVVLLASGEAVLGVWLLTGRAVQISWWSVIAVFASFAGVSMSKAFAGAETCRCLGTIHVQPSLMLIVDELILTALVTGSPSTLSKSQRNRGVVLAGLFCFVGFGLDTYHARYEMQRRLQDAAESESGLVVVDQTVVLSPQRWIGEPFPLLRYIDIGDELRSGEWNVVLYRHGCPSCEKLLARLDDEGLSEFVDDGARLALISFATNAQNEVTMLSGEVHVGKLVSSYEWVCQTPLLLKVSNGNVVQVITQAG